ncbi:protein O-GlcNAc transferase [Gammaproteobacteria bacterium]
MGNTSYEAALLEHQTGNLDAAEKLYRDLLEITPQNAAVLHLLGILLTQKHEFLNAYHFVEQALKIDPKSSSFHNSMGGILKNLNKYEDAILQYQQALQLNPNSPATHNNIGNVLYQLGKLQEAKEHYYEAIRLKPQYVDAHCNLSLVLTKQNLTQEAIAHLETAIQLQPSYDLPHQQLAHLLQLQGALDKATYHYRIALKNNGNNILAHHNLGVILTDEGKYEEAISHFKRVLDLQPQHIEALHNLGSVFLLQKKPAEALPYFLQLAKLMQDFDVYYNVGVIYTDLSRFDDAIIYFDEAMKIRPDDFSVCVNLGTIYLRRQNFAEAEKYYSQAHHLQPNNQEISYILAALQQKDDLQKAPAEYVQHLFDQYAPYFEQHLKLLNYQVPECLFDIVQAIVDPKGCGCSLKILDLGCGTGMCGSKFKPMAQELIGIDLSAKMLEFAKQKNIYSDLKNITIEEAITTFSGIDLIIAAESLVYFGALEKIFTCCYSTLKSGGIFAFTVEKTDQYPYTLQRSARFAHTVEYINQTASESGFIILKSNEITLRKHYETVIKGFIFVLQKPIR